MGHRSARQASAHIRTQEASTRYQLALRDTDMDDMDVDPFDEDGNAWLEDPEEVDILAEPNSELALRIDPEVRAEELEDYGYNATHDDSDDENGTPDDDDDEAALGPEDGEEPMLDDYEELGFAEL